MSDRSDEVTTSRDDRSTDDLLEETERLLEESGTGSESSPSDAEAASSDTDASAFEPDSWQSTPEPASPKADSATESDSAGGLRSRLPSLGFGAGSVSRSVSPSEYFSPKGFLAAVLLLGVGMFAGGAVPLLSTIGQLIGLFAVAFGIGLATSKRRYLEMLTAGVLVGVLGVASDYAMFVMTGSGSTVFFIGAAIGLVSTGLGYYFGRDLRDGLARDIE